MQLLSAAAAPGAGMCRCVATLSCRVRQAVRSLTYLHSIVTQLPSAATAAAAAAILSAAGTCRCVATLSCRVRLHKFTDELASLLAPNRLLLLLFYLQLGRADAWQP
jgi:hypothetical protein